MEFIKELAGLGKVLRGAEELCETNYRLRVYQKFIEGPTHNSGPYRIPGHKEIVGSIDIILPVGERLTLITEEGYRVQFWCPDETGSIDVSGLFTDADGKPVNV